MSLPLRQSPRKAKSAFTALMSSSVKKTANSKASTSSVATADSKYSALSGKSEVATTKAKIPKPTVKAESPSPRKAVKAVPPKPTPKKARAASSLKRKIKEEEEEDEDDEYDDESGSDVKTATKKKPAAKAKASKAADVAKPAKKAKITTASKASKGAGDGTPLAKRTDVASLPKAMYIGAHVSSAGGVQNAVPNSVHVGGNAFALFLKSQRKWQNPPLADEARDAFQAKCKELGYDAGRHCLPHGSYLVNLAQPDKAKADQAYNNFVDDLRRCHDLGIRLYNFHPGAAVAGSGSREAALGRIAAALNKAHADTAPSEVVTVIENMAGGGSTVGDRFEDLKAIIDQIEDKSRVGVCLDTCHSFAAGYDLRTPESFAKVVADFDRIVGLSYLRAFHVNDSKAPLGSRRDLHANIGTGFLGLRAFHSLVNTDAFAGLPMLLETPIERPGKDGKEVEDRQVWADEIKLLESLIGMDPESDEFAAKAKALQAEGANERKRVQEQVDKKSAKDAKKKK